MTESAAELLGAAQAGNRRALKAVFADVHPSVTRLARSLCGDVQAGDRVAEICFKHAVNVLSRWSAGQDPQNWFAHHAVQTSRQVCPGRPDPVDDALANALPPAERTPALLALIRGVRRLPPQQAEAFILHHAERLNTRLIGVAMDCSMQAASTHLMAADQAIKMLVGEQFDALTEQLRRACMALTPPTDQSERVAGRYAGQWVAARLRRRVMKFGAFLLIVGLAVVGWFLWRRFAATP